MIGKRIDGVWAALALGIALFVSTSRGEGYLIEGFEDQSDPGSWRELSPSPQTHNAENATAPSGYVTQHVTEGKLAGEFEFNWIIPPVQSSTANFYREGGPPVYWSMRIDLNTPGALPNGYFANNGLLKADIYNNTAEEIQVAFLLHDGGGLERTPFNPLPPFALTTVVFDGASDPVTPHASGNGTLDGTSSAFRGLIVYTETQPIQSPFSMTVDNIRVEWMDDCCWIYGPPRLLAAQQGSAPGKLYIEWEAEPDPELGGFKIYMGGDEHFGNPYPNALQLPGPAAAVVGPDVRSLEIDVPTTGPVYVAIAPFDTALPNPNELPLGIALGASLRPDGAKPDDLVVLDLDRFAPDSVQLQTARYRGMIVYNAQALAAAGRFFESASAEAVETGHVALTSNPDGVVIWSNGFDGDATSPVMQTIADGAIDQLRAYVESGGKLMISGSAVGKGLAVNGSAVAQSFFRDTLGAKYVSDEIGVEVYGGHGPFDRFWRFNTGPEDTDLAAWRTTDNEVYEAEPCAQVVFEYSEMKCASVVQDHQVVLFGFPFETVRDNAHPTFEDAAAMRASLLQGVLDYLLAPPKPIISYLPHPTIVESFEDNTDPASWTESSASPQTVNAINNWDAPSSYRRDFATNGVQSGRFEFDWVLPGSPISGSNPYYPEGGGPTTYWSMRLNVAQPGGLAIPSLPIQRALVADLYNSTSDTVQVAFCVMDQDGELERGAFQSLPPRAMTTVSCGLYGGPMIPFISGDGILDGGHVIFKGFLIYSETAPTQTRFSMDVDNIRLYGIAPTCCGPRPPQLRFVGQGSAPGKLRVDWDPPTIGDGMYPGGLTYRFYLAGSREISNRIPERLEFPSEPVVSLCAHETSVEIDAPTTGPIYVRGVALGEEYDNLVISHPGSAMGASLRPDGLPPEDLVVLDQYRYNTPDMEEQSVYGYVNLGVYPAQALDAAGRHFQSCSASAIADDTIPLTPDFQGAVLWSIFRDEEIRPEQTLADANIERLQTFLVGGGNLFLSGSGIGNGLGDLGSPLAQSFLRNSLRVDSTTAGTSNWNVAAGSGPFASVGPLRTGPRLHAYAAGATSSNEVFQPMPGSLTPLSYDNGGHAAVLSGNSVVFLGFPLEAVRDANSETASYESAAAARAALVQAALDYLLAPPTPPESSGWMIR